MYCLIEVYRLRIGMNDTSDIGFRFTIFPYLTSRGFLSDRSKASLHKIRHVKQYVL